LKIALVLGCGISEILNEFLDLVKPVNVVKLYSQCEELSVAAAKMGLSFEKFERIEDLAGREELEEFDGAVVALDDDSRSVEAAKILKAMDVPTVAVVLRDSRNAEVVRGAGVGAPVPLASYAAAAAKALFVLDSWVLLQVLPSPSLGIALHRVAKRGALGVPLGEVVEEVVDAGAKVFAVDKLGRLVEDPKHVISAGDTIIVVGIGDSLYKAVSRAESVFRRHEEVLARRYAEMYGQAVRG